MDSYPTPCADVPASQIYMSKDVRKFGMIRKKSGGKKFPFQDPYDLRFVIIHKGWVYYYKDKSSEKPQNKFSLQGFSNTVINAEEEEALHPFVFKVYSKKANERTWYFAAETELDMEQWMEAFKLEIEQYNIRGISHIRPSKSCPEKPQPGSLGMVKSGITDRPQSVHAAIPMPNHMPTSQFSSHTNMTVTSGIGSSTQSIDDDFYEPMETTAWSDFDTDSEDSVSYEEPADNFIPCPPPSRSTPNFKPLENRPQYGPAPVIPPRDPIPQAPPFCQDLSMHLQNSTLVKCKAFQPGPVQSPVSSPSAERHQHRLSKPIPPPPINGPPVLPLSSFRYEGHVFPSSSAKPTLPSRSTRIQSNVPQDHSTQLRNRPAHLRQWSAESSVNRENIVSPSEQTKRHSLPFSVMHEKLAEQLATKLGRAASPGQGYNKKQRPWSMAPVIPGQDHSSPSYHSSSPAVSPFSPQKKVFKPLPELPTHSEATEEWPPDFPSRPPPLPPGPQSISDTHPTTPGGCGNAGFEKPKPFAPLPKVLENTTSGVRNRFSPSPGVLPQPALPPKPRTPINESRNPMPMFKTSSEDDEYDDTGLVHGSAVFTESGEYDLPCLGDTYEDPYPQREPIAEAVYEEESRINKPISPLPQDKPVATPGPIPNKSANLFTKPKAESSSSWQNQPKSPINSAVKTNSPGWQTKVPFNGSPSGDADNKPSWVKRNLKSPVDPGINVKTPSASCGKVPPSAQINKSPVTSKFPLSAPAAVPPATATKPSWVKQDPGFTAQKPPVAPKKLPHKELAMPFNNSNENKPFGANSARPPLSQKPKPPVALKPVQPPKPSNSKPPSSHRPGEQQASNFAKMRGKFEHH